MILDSLTTFTEKQAVTVSAASSNGGSFGTGYIDLGPADVFNGNGTELLAVGEHLDIQVLQTATSVDAHTPVTGTVAVILQTADDAAFTSNLTTLLALGTFTAGSVAGTSLLHRLGPLSAKFRRYIRLYFTVGSGPLIAGAFSGWLARDSQQGQNYPSRINIS